MTAGDGAIHDSAQLYVTCRVPKARRAASSGVGLENRPNAACAAEKCSSRQALMYPRFVRPAAKSAPVRAAQ